MHTSLVLSFNKYFTISKKKKKNVSFENIAYIEKSLQINIQFGVLLCLEMQK